MCHTPFLDTGKHHSELPDGVWCVVSVLLVAVALIRPVNDQAQAQAQAHGSAQGDAAVGSGTISPRTAQPIPTSGSTPLREAAPGSAKRGKGNLTTAAVGPTL